MTESEHSFTASLSEPGSLRTLQQQVRSLQAIVLGALLALLLLSAGVNIYLYRQVSIVSKELGIATRVVQDFDSNKKERINSFVSNLVLYARTHQDFNPILQKYGLPPQAAPSPSGTPVAPGK